MPAMVSKKYETFRESSRLNWGNELDRSELSLGKPRARDEFLLASLAAKCVVLLSYISI